MQGSGGVTPHILNINTS